MKDIHEEILALSDYLSSREEVRNLKEVEKKMENDQEVISLSNAFNLAQREYSDALKHYKEGSEELKKYYYQMYEAKLKLDSNEIVSEYYSLFNKVNEPLLYLELNLLSKFKIKKKGEC